MKIGILTFHCAVNYGAVLQAYGLQEYLRNLGHEVYIIDYRPKYLVKPYRSFRMNIPDGGNLIKIKSLIKSILIAPIRWKKNMLFDRFRYKYLRLCYLDLNNCDNDFDAFVFGSDQIWNPEITEGFDNVYFGDFPAAKGKLTISYAASAGNILHIKGRNDFTLLLRNINSIGVREQVLSAYINSINIKSEVVVDPVLLDIKIFDGIAVKPREKKSYLILFSFSEDAKQNQIANIIADQLDLRVIKVIASGLETLKIGNTRQNLSPEMFIGYFKYATYILTSSFHGMLFSIMYKKDFNIIGDAMKHDERILSVLSSLKLSDRIIDGKDRIEISHINYQYVDVALNQMKEQSRSFLMEKVV